MQIENCRAHIHTQVSLLVIVVFSKIIEIFPPVSSRKVWLNFDLWTSVGHLTFCYLTSALKIQFSFSLALSLPLVFPSLLPLNVFPKHDCAQTPAFPVSPAEVRVFGWGGTDGWGYLPWCPKVVSFLPL